MNNPLSNLSGNATALVDSVAHSADQLTQRGLQAVLDGSRQMRDQSLRAKDSTLGFIRAEPTKSVLIAAALGAGLMALLTLVGRTNRSHH